MRNQQSFAELVDKLCGAGFSLRGTSVPPEARAGTCARQPEACPKFRHRILRTSIILLCVALAAAAPAAQEASHNGVTISSQAVGHQYRQDDWPAIAAAPDGSIWVAWLSFDGARDDVALRHYQNGKWSNIHWAPNTSGDSWLPQVAVDSANRPWVVWSQQLNGNWDIYARRFDPGQQEWGSLERLTSDPLHSTSAGRRTS